MFLSSKEKVGIYYAIWLPELNEVLDNDTEGLAELMAAGLQESRSSFSAEVKDTEVYRAVVA
jgi:hypothetical protein